VGPSLSDRYEIHRLVRLRRLGSEIYRFRPARSSSSFPSRKGERGCSVSSSTPAWLCLTVRDVSLGQRPGHDRLFEEPAEEEPATPRGSSVEAKGKLLEVGLQVVRADRALVGTQDPAPTRSTPRPR
jgi:hypothetical protein